MNAVPRLTVGLPVYNGENYLAEAIEALLGQTYENFELVISDNASTDDTADVCQHYAKQDSRIRYVRQPRNIGCAPNHCYLVHEARGELFKWAAHDDLYARDLLKRCIDALDEFPDVVLAHSWTAMIDGSGAVTKAMEYPLATCSPRPSERFRSMLFDKGGDDDGGVIRMDVLRRTPLLGSYYHADRTIIADLCLYGPFYQVPDWLYFRRDHPDRAERAFPDSRSWCTNLDPRRADRLRHPKVRLYAEYIWAYMAAIQRAPLPGAERRECYRHLLRWLANRAQPGRDPSDGPAALADAAISVGAVVARRGSSQG